MIVVATAFIAGLIALLVGLMILWNNLVHRVTPSFALALDPGRDDACVKSADPGMNRYSAAVPSGANPC